MRTTLVFILRLLVDEDEPGSLRGILCNVTSGEQQAFSSEPALLELLHAQAGRTIDNGREQFILSRRTDL